MANFDYADLAIKVACGGTNGLLYDDKNNPSVMVKIPRFSWKDIGLGTSTDPFPAFIVNGQEIPGFWFSKYMNNARDGRAYSLPGFAFGYETFESSIARCSSKGAGWHLQTRLEWMAVALWSLRNGTLPKGNNNYGRDISEKTYKAIPTLRDTYGRTASVATGTGPVTWSHTHQQDGIWDMNGNQYEYVGGVRIVYGELQVLSKNGTFGNDAADPSNSQAANSALWYAIDGTTGNLITPDGTGTTTNSLKICPVSGTHTWITGSVSQSVGYPALEDVALDSTVCDASKRILQALGFYKPDGISSGDLGGDYLYYDNQNAERLLWCGGHYTGASQAGAFFVYGDYDREAICAFRAAYCDLPTA